ncbi:MAG: ribonuclease III [Myxococcales bacterium]|nr:ribonuclease III [Myxococcales bacterium]
MPEPDRIAAIEEALGYRFHETSLLVDALTHRSFLNERPDLASRDNERMEYLGDAIVDLAASALLFERYPEAREGELTRRRADLVCEAGLAAIARWLGLGEALRLGRGEDRSGGRTKPRLLASALEALVAAVYLDSDERSAITVARALLAPYVEQTAPGELDYKSRLQEVLQTGGGAPPIYEHVGSDGPDHDRIFHVEAMHDGKPIGRGSGGSKLRAEQLAARDALERLEAGVEPGTDR